MPILALYLDISTINNQKRRRIVIDKTENQEEFLVLLDGKPGHRADYFFKGWVREINKLNYARVGDYA